MTVDDTTSGSNTFRPDDAIKSAEITFDPNTDSIWAACSWFHQQDNGGRMKPGRAKQCICAVKSLWKYAGLGDSPTVKAFMEIDDLHTVWSNKNPGKSEKSAKDYVTKVNFVLGEFIQRCQDGGDYNRKRLMGKERKSVVERPAKPSKPSSPVSAPQTANSTRCSSSRGEITINLPCEASELTAEDISILTCHLATKMPAFTVKDAGIIGSHLATRGSDFDPTKSITSQLF